MLTSKIDTTGLGILYELQHFGKMISCLFQKYSVHYFEYFRMVILDQFGVIKYRYFCQKSGCIAV